MTDLDLPPRLHCSGGRFLKPNGDEIILRGINLGAWGEDDPLDCDAIKALGANAVRVAFRWHGVWGKPADRIDSRDNNGFAFLLRENVQRWLDILTSASAAGLWTIPFIDSNCGQSGTQDPETRAYCDPYNQWGAEGRNFYRDASLRRLFAQIVWPAAAAKLRTLAKVAMLEIHPEPAGDRGPDYTGPVAQVQRDIITAIREVDPDTPILVGARSGYEITLIDEAVNALAATGPMDNIAITGNLLSQWITNPDKLDKGVKALVAAREKYGLPAFVQQFGRKTGNDPTLGYLRAALDRLTAERLGFTYWQWKQNTENPDDYGLNYKDGHGGWIAKPAEQSLLSEYFPRHPTRMGAPVLAS